MGYSSLKVIEEKLRSSFCLTHISYARFMSVMLHILMLQRRNKYN